MFAEETVIEFPKYGSFESIPESLRTELLKVASNKKVHIIWTEEGDVFDFKGGKKAINCTGTNTEPSTFDPMKFEAEKTLVALGAADAMSHSGNERASASVEAAMGNNSNIRGVMNWTLNPRVFKAIEDAFSTPKGKEE